METRAPTIGRILIAVGFAISCFGLALFLWLAFGGAIPLKPESYRFTVPFQEATQLAVESDVRISGVSVGKVKRIDLNDEGYAEATLELDARYAPIPSDTRAILRQKTLLGETYVELSQGTEESEPLPEDGALPAAQVSDAVQLDEIFRAFDPETRAAFQAWMQGQAAALRGRGVDLSLAIASLDPFARQADRALRLLDSQSEAVSGLVRSGGEVFGALSERPGQLRGLITNANTVFETTARRNEDLATAFEIFPTFLRESRATLARLETFAADSDPVVQALQPTARELAPTVTALGRFSEQLDPFFAGLRGTIDAAPKGSRALRRLLDDDLPPLLERFDPFLAELNPVLEVIRIYRHEVTALFANVAASTNGLLNSSIGPRELPADAGHADAGGGDDLPGAAADQPHQPVPEGRDGARRAHRARLVRGPPVRRPGRSRRSPTGRRRSPTPRSTAASAVTSRRPATSMTGSSSTRSATSRPRPRSPRRPATSRPRSTRSGPRARPATTCTCTHFRDRGETSSAG